MYIHTHYYTLMGLGTAGFADTTTTTSTTDATTTATTAAPCAKSTTLMKHGPAGSALFLFTTHLWVSALPASQILLIYEYDRRYYHCYYCCSLCQFGYTLEARPCRLHS